MVNGWGGSRGPGSQGASGKQGLLEKGFLPCWFIVRDPSLTPGAPGPWEGSDRAPGVPWGLKETCIPYNPHPKGKSRILEKGSGVGARET